METTTKKRLGGDRIAAPRRPRAKTNKQFEAYLLSREILRNLQRTSALFPIGETATTRPH